MRRPHTGPLRVDADYDRALLAHLSVLKLADDEAQIVGAGASDDEIKARWRHLVRENHPDKLMARGVPPEFVKLANDIAAQLGVGGEVSLSIRIAGTDRAFLLSYDPRDLTRFAPGAFRSPLVKMS